MVRVYAQPLVRLTLIMSAIFVLLITLMFVESRMGGDGESEPDIVATDGRAAPVEEFIDFATAGPEEGPPVGLEHEYTSEGTRKLAAALRVLVSESGGAVTDELALRRTGGPAWTRSPFSGPRRHRSSCVHGGRQ